LEVVSLSRSDCALLSARFGQHGNSQRRMLAALEEAAANDSFARLAVLRKMEKTIGVDLGMLCYHFEHRNDATTHPFERAVMNYVAHWRINAMGGEDLWIVLDRVRQVRGVVEEGRLVGEPEA
jgi:hypothetical protein